VTTAYSTEILADFDKYDGKEVILAGRLMGKRIMGKASFAELKDAEGDSNLCCEMIFRLTKRKQCTMLFSKTIDITIIGVRGTVSERRWVKSVHIYTTVLAKALKPLPVVKNRC
jgi:lysyl-tRNA synthetase class 2